jgi:hypothetical protein
VLRARKAAAVLMTFASLCLFRRCMMNNRWLWIFRLETSHRSAANLSLSADGSLLLAAYKSTVDVISLREGGKRFTMKGQLGHGCAFVHFTAGLIG